jgi:hypothetical protein
MRFTEARSGGQPPYDPLTITKVLVYGYCVGVFSSRRIEKRLVEDIAFRILAAGIQPNFRTISDFRKIHLQTLAGMFEQVLKIALQAGAVKLGRVALDGNEDEGQRQQAQGDELRPDAGAGCGFAAARSILPDSAHRLRSNSGPDVRGGHAWPGARLGSYRGDDTWADRLGCGRTMDAA